MIGLLRSFFVSYKAKAGDFLSLLDSGPAAISLDDFFSTSYTLKD
jgi:hypothetical protein